VTPLERRCRRVVRLLPRGERAARGEEVLGVLMDLSAGRSRPPLAEVAAVAALSLNLRMRDRAHRFNAPVLVAAMLLVAAPWTSAGLVRHLSVLEVLGVVASELVLLLAVPGLWFVTAVAWLFGYRRTAVGLWVTLAAVAVADSVFVAVRFGPDAAPLGLGNPTVPVVLTAAALVVAAARGVTEPPQPGYWVWLHVGVGVASFVALASVGEFGAAPVAVAALAVAGGLVVTGRGRSAGVVPGLAAVALTAAGLVPLWLGLVVATAAVGMAFGDQPSASRAT
jgi:hypothetical protein